MNETEQPKKVWAFVHVAHEPMGSFEHVLRGYGIHPQVFLANQTDIEALDPSEADLVLMMGGPMGVYEADQFPHIHHEIRFAERRIAANKPLLGVCLGAQIIAAALGSRVYVGPQGKEIGWNPVSINPAGMQTPLKHLDQSECTCVHWHEDTFDMPKGATLLASSDKYQHQAFSYGDTTLALQFHPEVTEVRMERWYEHLLADITQTGKTVEQMRKETHQYADGLKRQNRLFFTEWLNKVAPGLLHKQAAPLVDAVG